MTQDTPSIQALDLAVKPAGYTWGTFAKIYKPASAVRDMALAYAADLDKADKERREVLELLEGVEPEDILSDGNLMAAKAVLRANLLPGPIDPDLLEAKAVAEQIERERLGQNMTVSELIREGIRRGRELAKEQDRG